MGTANVETGAELTCHIVSFWVGSNQPSARVARSLTGESEESDTPCATNSLFLIFFVFFLFSLDSA